MKVRLALLLGLLGLLVSTASATAASAELELAPVSRLPFPERGFVVDVPRGGLEATDVRVRENGLVVEGVRVDPMARSGLRYGVVLALDASESMSGAPAAAALASARAFVSHRSKTEAIGILTFNGRIAVRRAPSTDDAALRRTLASPPALAYGTRIHDAVVRSLALLRQSRLSSGSVVLLSDGADIGSTSSLEQAVAAAKQQRVRVFTVGLRSGAFEAGPLRMLADQTGGAYAEARSAAELEAIYEALGARLAGEYLIRYRSAARPMSRVEVQVDIAQVGVGRAAYAAPTPSLLEPYHRSALTRFLLSDSSPLLISLFVALLACALIVLVGRRPRTTVVDRVRTFAGGDSASRRARAAAVAPPTAQAPRKQYAGGWWADLERDLELARMTTTPLRLMTFALIGTAAIFLLAVSLSVPVIGVFGLLTPFLARAYVTRKLKALRAEFADQFPGNLQVLASALRAGHSFNGALGVVVDNAQEPARSELGRVLQDDRLGVLPEVAIRRMARRMANRDIEQVALLAELQRTSGGNSAEILDTVVGTIRERGEMRRLVQTLTAQGRMARWILTALPIFLTGFLWLIHPEVMSAFFTSAGGQVGLVMAALMVAAGSAFIQKIIDIDV